MSKLEIIKNTATVNGLRFTVRWDEPPLVIIRGCPFCGQEHRPVVVCGEVRVYPCPRVPAGVLLSLGELLGRAVDGDLGLGAAIARNVADAYRPALPGDPL